ncbi:MAG TPA: MFS transporter [Steroidobacteraceae bacterium]|nr:MFS transporter [Steroidobacteraceae bacterium]
MPEPGATQPTRLVEAIYRREILPWSLLGIGLGLVEGATVAVLVKKIYSPTVSAPLVNFAVALVSGAPALANIVSFIWANIAHGRARVRLLAGLQATFALLVGLIALAPQGSGGLLLTLLSVIAARMIWAGVLTVRAAVWSANYPRHVMARVTGRIVMLGAMGVAAVALLAGWVLDHGGHQARWLYVLAAVTGLVAAWRYRAVRVRREYQLLAAEADAGGQSQPFSLGMLRAILREDSSFRGYMACMGLYGSGNLMISALLVVLFSDRLRLPGATQILLLTVLPLVLMPLFLPWWARLFDRGHIIAYRSRQCWALVASALLFTLGVTLRAHWLLWPASVLYGFSLAGSNLGWNLGHNDFASRGRAQHYMGVHVTLTGVRGLAAPPLGMLAYQLLENRRAGWGVAAMALPLLLVTSGAIGFVRQNLRENRP